MKLTFTAISAILAATASAGAFDAIKLAPRQGTATIPAGAGPSCAAGDAAGLNPNGFAGLGQGNQFATGCCLSDADCTTGCCGRLTGVCQNLGVANNANIGGCGFTPAGGAGGANAAPAPAPAPAAQPAANNAPGQIPQGAGPRCTNAANQNPGVAGTGAGNQFVTGCCFSDADCAQRCCGRNTGVCQGPEFAVNPASGAGGCGGTFGGQ